MYVCVWGGEGMHVRKREREKERVKGEKIKSIKETGQNRIWVMCGEVGREMAM